MVFLRKMRELSWSSGNAFLSGTGGSWFKSRPVKSNAVLPTTRYRCDISSKKDLCCPTQWHGIGPQTRVVNGPTSSSPGPKTNLKLKSCPKKLRWSFHSAMLPSYFDYILVRLWQKARLRPELSAKFLSTLGPKPTWKARPNLQLCLKLLTHEYCTSNRASIIQDLILNWWKTATTAMARYWHLYDREISMRSSGHFFNPSASFFRQPH